VTRTILVAFVVVSGSATAATESEGVSLTYDVISIDRKLFLDNEPEPRRLHPGDRPVSGDRLRTGSSSAAMIGEPTHTAVFRLGSKTRCTLAHDRPGVLLHVERGWLRALFGSDVGGGPRLVTTPSAVLAVRGTEYGLRVDKKGDTHVVVFEGVVEVSDPDGGWEPLRIEAGQESRIRFGRSPEAVSTHRLTPHDWDRGFDRPPPGSGRDRSMVPGAHGMSPGTASGAGQGNGSGGSKRRGG
jgi:hypothetical protein